MNTSISTLLYLARLWLNTFNFFHNIVYNFAVLSCFFRIDVVVVVNRRAECGVCAVDYDTARHATGSRTALHGIALNSWSIA